MKSDYYSGRMSQEELDRLEWQPFLVKVLKGEVNSYVESDDDIIKLKTKNSGHGRENQLY